MPKKKSMYLLVWTVFTHYPQFAILCLMVSNLVLSYDLKKSIHPILSLNSEHTKCIKRREPVTASYERIRKAALHLLKCFSNLGDLFKLVANLCHSGGI